MADRRRNILVLVEGAKTDVALMNQMLKIYGIDADYQIVSYCTNIYTLYHEMFELGEPEDIDLLQLLKEKERDPEKKLIFDNRYSDILLVFDLDPQDGMFAPEKIQKLTEYFVESSDMGKLYLNYPMVEAFYHMKTIPDPDYNTTVATMVELTAGTYKQRVNRENRNHDYRKYAVNRHEWNCIIRQNIEKSWKMLGQGASQLPPEQQDILCAELKKLTEAQIISVLCTCVFFIAEYNPRLLELE